MAKRPASPSQLVSLPQKKQRSENPQSRRVGMFCVSTDKEYEEIKIYVLDIDGRGDGGGAFEYIHPAVRIQLPRSDSHHQAFCVQGSTLYIFYGGNTFLRLPDANRRTVMKFVLPSQVLGVAGGGVGEEILEYVSDMNHIKHYPQAILTPDSKHILVFSTSFFFEHDDHLGASPRTAFELYDIGSDSWVTLPGLPSHPFRTQFEYPAHVSVVSFSFVEESVFFLCTSEGCFTLNLKVKEWTRILVKGASNRDIGRDYFVLLCNGRIALLPTKLQKSKDDRMVFEADDMYGFEVFRALPCPLSEFPPANPPDWFHNSCPSPSCPHVSCNEWRRFLQKSVVPLQPNVFSIQEDGACDTCTLQTVVDGGVHLLVDVHRIHLKNLNTDVLHTVKARIDYVGDIRILELFPLP